VQQNIGLWKWLGPPDPPVLIAGPGEQMTFRAGARLADACNNVDGDVAEVRHKPTMLRSHVATLNGSGGAGNR
jgi:hypothetical protein